MCVKIIQTHTRYWKNYKQRPIIILGEHLKTNTRVVFVVENTGHRYVNMNLWLFFRINFRLIYDLIPWTWLRHGHMTDVSCVTSMWVIKWLINFKTIGKSCQLNTTCFWFFFLYFFVNTWFFKKKNFIYFFVWFCVCFLMQMLFEWIIYRFNGIQKTKCNK